MAESDMLATALADIRRRMAELQADYERVSAELGKLRMAEKSLAAIVEGGPSGEAGLQGSEPHLPGESPGRAGRGSRGPRANSAKGRLRALLESAGPQGLSQAEIGRRLPDVAPNTLSSYLSVLVTGGEAIRKGDFIAAAPSHVGPAEEEEPDDAES